MESLSKEENSLEIVLELKEIYDSYNDKRTKLENQNQEFLENATILHKELEEIEKKTKKMTEKQEFYVDQSKIRQKNLFKISLHIKELKLESLTYSTQNNPTNSQAKATRLNELKKEAENWAKNFNELLEKYKIVKGFKFEESYYIANKEKAIGILENKERELIKLRSLNKKNKIYVQNFEKLETFSTKTTEEINKLLMFFIGGLKKDNEIEEMILNNYEFISLQNKISKMRIFENLLEDLLKKKSNIEMDLDNEVHLLKSKTLNEEIENEKKKLKRQWNAFFFTHIETMLTSIDKLKQELQNIVNNYPDFNKEMYEILYLLEELDPILQKEDKTIKKLHEINEKIKKNEYLSIILINITKSVKEMMENYENIGNKKREAKKTNSSLKGLIEKSKILNYLKDLSYEEQNISVLARIPKFPCNFDMRHEEFIFPLSKKRASLGESVLDFEELSILEDLFLKKMIIQEFLQNNKKKEIGEITSQITKNEEKLQSLERDIEIITNYIDLEMNSFQFNQTIQEFLKAIDKNLKDISEPRLGMKEETEKWKKLKPVKSLLKDELKKDIEKCNKESKKIRDHRLKQEELKEKIQKNEIEIKKINNDIEIETENKKKAEEKLIKSKTPKFP